MIKAIKLEWLKIRNYKTFWVLLGMYFLALTIICFGGMFFLEYLKSEGAEFEGIDPTMLPIYDFPDIWQNMTYLGSFLRILLAFIVIITVNNDQIYNTLRQNIIDGVSKGEYLTSKLLFVVILAMISTLFVFIAGLINGALYSHVWGLEFLFDGTIFLFAYFYDIVIFCSLAFLLSLLFKKSGFVIVLLFLYSMMFEPILGVIIEHAVFLQDTIFQPMVNFLPVKALNNLITVPFPRYIFREITDYLPLGSFAIASAWLAFYLSAILLILKRRDLK